jgi:hypothetical protein
LTYSPRNSTTLYSHFAPALIGLFIATVVAVSSDRWAAWQNEAMPPDQFFSVKTLSIPNFIEGEDPLISYDRDIKKEFYGDWIVSIHQVKTGEDYPICSGSGSNHYITGETLPKVGVTLDWFIGKSCDLHAGQYTIQASWGIHGDSFSVKHYTHNSNIFTVLPKGSQLYITPDQVKKIN